MTRHQVRFEDQGLAPEQYPSLNRRFFTEKYGPHVFLKHRLRGALLASTSGESVRAVFEEGVSVGTLNAFGSSWVDDLQDDDLAQFAALESIVLFHHAAEVLLRLTLAVKDDPPCPWLDITRLRQPGVFPKKVADLRKHLRDDATQDSLSRIFYASPDRNTPPPDVAQSAWEESLKGLTGLIEECARRSTQESAVYNSAKHGLSAVQGTKGMSFGEDDTGTPLVSSDGPSLTILEVKTRADSNQKQWHETVHWIEADKTLSLVFLISRQIENLWTVARWRYAGSDTEFQMNPLPAATLSKVIDPKIPADGPGYRFVVPSMSMSLLYAADSSSFKRHGHGDRKRS